MTVKGATLREPNPPTISSESVVQVLRQAGVSHVVTVPDWVQISVHQLLVSRPELSIDVVPCCTEDEAMVVAAGLYLAGKRPLIVIQNQGFYAGINALRAIGLDAGLPLVMMIGQFGREAENRGKPYRLSRRRVVRILEPLLDALEVPHVNVEGPSDLPQILDAFEMADSRSWPTAIIIANNTIWPA